MRSLNANMLPYVDTSFTVFYLIRVTCRDGVNSFHWGTISTGALPAWVDDVYTPTNLKDSSLGTSSRSIDVSAGGALGRVSDWSFTLINFGYDATLRAVTLRGARVEIARFIKEASPTCFEDGDTRFVGKVYRIQYQSDDGIKITCESDESEQDLIPGGLIDAATFPDMTIPDESKGKPIPIHWGVLEKAEGFFCNIDETVLYGPRVATGGDNDYLEDTGATFSDDHIGKDLQIVGGPGRGGIYLIESRTGTTKLNPRDIFQVEPSDGTVYQITDTAFDMLVAAEELKGFLDSDGVLADVSGGHIPLFLWDDDTKSFMPLDFYKFINYVYSMADFSLANPGKMGWKFYAQMIEKNELLLYFLFPFDELVNSGSWTNPENIIDGDPDTYGEYTTSGSNPSNIKGRMTVNRRDLIGSWDGLYGYCIASDVYTHGDDSVQVHFGAYKSNGSFIGYSDTGPIVSANDKYYSGLRHIVDLPSGFTAASINSMHDLSSLIDAGDWQTLIHNRQWWFRVDPNGLVPPYEADINIYEAGLVFTKTIPLNEQTRIFVGLHGRVFGDTWGSRRTASGLIEHPADVIEKILRDDLGVASSRINTNSFDAVVAARSGWKCAFSQMKQEESRQVIQRLCQEHFLAFFEDMDGKYALHALPTSGTALVTLSDHNVDTDNRQRIIQSEASSIDQVFNQFHVHYKKNPATGDYEGHQYMLSPDGASFDAAYTSLSDDSTTRALWSRCQTSYARYGSICTKTINLDTVRDDTTAQAVLAMAIRWHAYQQEIITIQHALDVMALEQFDCVELDNLHSDGDHYVTDIKEDLDSDKITLTFRSLL